MADFDKGQTFIDFEASNINQTKAKYFIGLSDAYDNDDTIICFVMNTEKRLDRYHFNCNRENHRFIIPVDTFSFIKKPTSIMLISEWWYTLNDMYANNIKLLDKASDLLARQIKNCIDWNFLRPKSRKLILNSFKL